VPYVFVTSRKEKPFFTLLGSHCASITWFALAI